MNKINYQIELDNLIKSISESDKVPTLLLHSCCAPCSSYVVTYLMQYFDVTVLYYNPNIFPEEEYQYRLREQIRLIETLNKEMISSEDIKSLRPIKLLEVGYDYQEFLDVAAGLENEREGGARCTECFKLRLNKTYDLARERNFDYYGTTLTVSPHKNAILINAIGEEIAVESFTSWLPSDFKKREGYKQSIELSKKYELYRQNYCGCEFSIY